MRFLPRDFHRKDIESGRLQIVKSRPSILPLDYVAACRSDRPNALVGPLSDLAVTISDFEQGPRSGSSLGSRRQASRV